jgi:hypothetical protein
VRVEHGKTKIYTRQPLRDIGLVDRDSVGPIAIQILNNCGCAVRLEYFVVVIVVNDEIVNHKMLEKINLQVHDIMCSGNTA